MLLAVGNNRPHICHWEKKGLSGANACCLDMPIDNPNFVSLFLQLHFHLALYVLFLLSSYKWMDGIGLGGMGMGWKSLCVVIV